MMSDMKRYGLLILVLILIVSCSSNVFRGEERIGESFISVESKGFDGEKSYRIEVDSDTYASMDLRVEEGVLSIIVENGKSKPLEGNYSEEWNQNKNTTFFLNKGEYSVTLKGKAFVGKCMISWDTN